MTSARIKDQLPISAIVCTLNEEQNIVECIESIKKNDPAEIIVVDGNSDDNTVGLAQGMSVKISVCERNGLAYQRYIGTDIAQKPYVAFIDADDVLDFDCLQRLLEDIQDHDCSAVQAVSRTYSTSTYWERAMESLNVLRSRRPGPTNMVGRPALYKKDSLLQVGIDKHWGRIGNEDTDLAIQFEKKHYKMRIGNGYSSRKHAKTLHEWMAKWMKYGKGDAKLMVKYPRKRKSILHHLLLNYPIKLSIEAMRKGFGRYVPFYVLFGLSRFFFMSIELVQNYLQQLLMKSYRLRKLFVRISH